MKKIITILFLALMPFFADAQHLQFMGIPLDGSIDNFHAKLLNKGLKFDKNDISTGIRTYKGRFAGENAEYIFVYFCPKTLTVYGATACIASRYYDSCISTMEIFKSNICDKYKGRYSIKEGTKNEFKSYDIYISSKDGTQELGTIMLYIAKVFDDFSLYVGYFDNDNFDAKKAIDSEDFIDSEDL